MIKQKLSLFALAVLAGAVMSATNASALSYSAGDLLLGFRSGGSETYSYIVDIGNNSSFRSSDGSAFTGSAFNLTIGGVTTGALGADLTAAFGASWNTRTDLYWGVVGAVGTVVAPDKAQTVYISSATATAGGSAALANAAQATQSPWRASIAGAGGQYANTTPAALNPPNSAPSNSVGLFQANADTSSWASKLGGSGQNFASGNAFSTGKTIEASVGGSSNKLDLWRLAPTTGAGTAADINLGTFSINSAGTVSYSAVPEPSTWALMGLGLGAVVFAVRRRQIKA